MSRVVIGQSVDPLDHCSLESFQSGRQQVSHLVRQSGQSTNKLIIIERLVIG